MSEIRIADLFAGIGGIRMGMVQALGDAAHVVYSSEWNKYSVQTYEANWHDENPVAGDITKVDEHDVPDIDLLLAGFPCQPFSIAGVSKKQSMGRPTGFEDKTQGTLFFDVARIIKAKQPKAFLLENVKNLLSHDRGRTFKTIYSVLTEDLGYHVTYKLIDADQHRLFAWTVLPAPSFPCHRFLLSWIIDYQAFGTRVVAPAPQGAGGCGLGLYIQPV